MKSLKDLLDQLDADRKKLTIFFKLWHWHIVPMYHNVRCFIKGTLFKLRHGFDYRDCYNLDVSIAMYTLPRIKYLKKVTRGYPVDVATFKEWQKILTKIIFSLEVVVDNYESLLYKSNKEHLLGIKTVKKRRAKFDEGMSLFSKYFTKLWD